MATGANLEQGSENDEKIVVEQSYLKVDEVFIYRIPPMRSADGHRAEDWNLAKPLATCSLNIVRRDDVLCVNIMAERPKPAAPRGATETYLFAQSIIQVDCSKPDRELGHWVAATIDSSRYFALRISDSKSGREALIGIGFRERIDATNLRMSLQDYVNALKREKKAAEFQKNFVDMQSVNLSADIENSSGAQYDKSEQSSLPYPALSGLSLKEGEKIHINLKGKRINGCRPNKPIASNGVGVGEGIGKGGLLLRKPPPPGVPSSASFANETRILPASPDDQAKKRFSDNDDWGDFEG